jgi:hypothetical protein
MSRLLSSLLFHFPFPYNLFFTASNKSLALYTSTYKRYEQITHVSSSHQWLADHKSCPLGLAQDQKSISHNLISVVCFENDSFPSYFRPVVLELWDGGLKM